MKARQLSLLLVLGCGGGQALPMEPEPPPPEPLSSAEQALALYPRLIDLHAGPIQRSCSPNPGVCHNANNFPDLQTPGALLSLVGERCNLDIPDPSQGWDGCERAPDLIRAGRFESDLAFVEPLSPGRWRLHFREPPASSERVSFSVWSAKGELVLQPLPDWQLMIDLQQGQTMAETSMGILETQPFVVSLVDEVVRALVVGDPNQNGIFGADDPQVQEGAEIYPGSLEQSYLWGRLNGSVPGTRMPLANAQLTDAEFVALACWIEGLADDPSPAIESQIDYAGCEYARAAE